MERASSRPGVTESDVDLMTLWNEHVRALAVPLVSDRMLPDACRRFARAHADILGQRLHDAFRSHLSVMWEHNLLHRDDVLDCLRLSGSPGTPPTTDMCDECKRPVHESHCALAGRARGAASWPLTCQTDPSVLATMVAPRGRPRLQH